MKRSFALFAFVIIAYSCQVGYDVEYRVTGSGKADILFHGSYGDDLTDAKGLTLPWTYGFELDPNASWYAACTAMIDSSSSSSWVKVEFYIDGDRVESAYDSGPYACASIAHFF